MKYLAKTDQLLGACVGDKPSVFLLDPATGTVSARVAIGKGLDALAIDAARGRIVTSNHEGTMTVIGWDGASALRHVATIRTSPGERMVDICHRSWAPSLVNAHNTDFPGRQRTSVRKGKSV